MSLLDRKIFTDDAAAYAFLESIVWAGGPVCPHCGGMERVGKLKGGRPGLRKCYHCRKQFTVTVGTVFESSHIPLHKWLQAAFLLCSSKKGISSHQLHRILQVTYKTAWFMAHRLREAMRLDVLPPMGGEGKTVEADETYFGQREEPIIYENRTYTKGGRNSSGRKRAILSLVERDGSVRSFHVDRMTKAAVNKIVGENVSRESRLYTDESRLYADAEDMVREHDAVKHSAKEYVRGEVHTNTIEGFFSIFKRGMKGIYQHCGEQHLHRYLAEFDFRYNARKVTDAERTVSALEGIKGKRLTYRPANS